MTIPAQTIVLTGYRKNYLTDNELKTLAQARKDVAAITEKLAKIRVRAERRAEKRDASHGKGGKYDELAEALDTMAAEVDSLEGTLRHTVDGAFAGLIEYATNP